MQKVEGGMTLFGPKKVVLKPGEMPIERHKTAGFGLEFPWARAELHADGKTHVIYEKRHLEEVNHAFEEIENARVAARLVFDMM